MRNWAVAQSPADFDAWVATQRAPAVEPPAGTEAAEGFTLFATKGCSGCHTVEGVSRGKTGPNLTHLFSRETFAGSMFTLNTDNLHDWLQNPPGVKPGAKMPNLKLSSNEITKLIAYLETLR
jgi:cytochrome c oxidase subunit 2